MYWKLTDLLKHSAKVKIDGCWLPARPVKNRFRSIGDRIHNSCLVLVGKADIVVWPGGQ